MQTERYNIWNESEYTYQAAYGFMPNIRTYLHEDDQIRDCMLVVPGGGYCMVVPPEAQLVAKEFYDRGMNAFVLTYTTDITMSVPLKDQPLRDISRAVRFIRSKAKEFHIHADRVTICGFSAGAHVCGSLCTHFEDVKESNAEYQTISNRPNAAILSYPVITTGEFTHIYSVQALLGKNPSEEELHFFSLEKNVTENTPPCFLWQTATDDLVPVENSYLMAASLKEKGVPFAHYVFPTGHHGLSIPTPDYFLGNFGETYTMEQVDNAIENVKNRTAINVSEERRSELMEQFFGQQNLEADSSEKSKTEDEVETALENETDDKGKSLDDANANTDVNQYPDVRMWPDLAMHWLATLK